MAKIGRNNPCPCGSGIKFKKCCLKAQAATQAFSPTRQLKISLVAQIERIQASAVSKEEDVRELGVFILWSNAEGDAWLFETTESDAVQVARGGEILDAPLDENPETIAINWSHTFAFRDRQLYLTGYEDKQETLLENAPVKRINAALRRIRKRFTEEQLRQVHISPAEADQGT